MKENYSLIKNKIKTGVACFLIIMFVGFCLNVLSFLLPQEPIHNHIVNSIGSFQSEGGFPQLVHGYKETTLDNNSDAWMLLMCDYNGKESFWKKAMGGYYHIYPTEANSGLVGMDHLPEIQNNLPISTNSYSRYWHGWLFFIRFALLFFDYSDIRMINMFLQFLLIIACFICLDRKKLSDYSLALGTAFLILVPIATAISFEYSFIFYIVTISYLCILCFHDKIEKQLGYSLFFMILGMTTSYFDFLTFPILTLGMPLTLLLILDRQSANSSGLILSKWVIKYSIFWAIGYSGMWCSKWILGSIVLHRNLFTEALDQVVLRTSHTDGIGVGVVDLQKIGYRATVMRNIETLVKKPYILLVLMELIIYLTKIEWFNRSNSVYKQFFKLFPYLLIAIMPFVWWYVLMNHSFIHNHFTYRSIALSVYAVLCGIYTLKKEHSK